jgi:hypothetical protein
MTSSLNSTTSPVSGNAIVRLSLVGDYQEWRMRVEQQLRSTNVWSIVSGAKIPPVKPEPNARNTDRNAIKDWQDYVGCVDSAIAQINISLSSELCKAYEIDECCPEGDSKALWDAIEKDQTSRVKRNAMHLRAELYKVKLDEEHGTVARYISRIQSPCEQISIAEQTITDAERYFHLLKGLPSEWGTTKI